MGVVVAGGAIGRRTGRSAASYPTLPDLRGPLVAIVVAALITSLLVVVAPALTPDGRTAAPDITTEQSATAASSQRQLVTDGAVPDGFTADEWSSIQRQIAAEAAVAIPPSGALASGAVAGSSALTGATAQIASAGMVTRFSAAGAAVTAAAAERSVTLQAGTVGDLTLGSTEPVMVNDRADYLHTPMVTEWYRDTVDGLQQLFTIAEPVTNGPTTTIVVDVAEGTPRLVNDQTVVIDATEDGRFVYRDLIVWDATGALLPAAMDVVDDAITLNVETAGAKYPITIDPIITSAQKIGDFPSAGTELGTAVAVDGNLLAISAPNETTPVPSGTTGAVYIYERLGLGDIWVSVGYIPNPSPSYGDFGRSIAINGSRIAIGAPGSSFGVADQGVVLVYDRTGPGGNWALDETLGAGGAGSFQFGYSIDYADDGLLVVGAPGFDGGVAQTEGQVFSYDGEAIAEIDAVGPTSGIGAEMGSAVAVAVRPGGGHRLIVGAPGDDGGNGLVQILDDTGAGFFVRTGFTGSGRLGSSVDVDGDRVVHNNGDDNVNVLSTPNAGANWVNELVGSFPRSSEVGANHFVDLEGGTLVAGAQGSNQVQIFRFNGVDWGVALGGALGWGRRHVRSVRSRCRRSRRPRRCARRELADRRCAG